MFEKEAEKYLGNLDECRTKDLMRDAFKDGAKFGYSKANEWHYRWRFTKYRNKKLYLHTKKKKV